MKFIESQTVELKREYTDEIKKTVVAFANCVGGNIYIGVDDDGKAVGVNDVDNVCQKITSSLKNSIKPDIVMFFNVKKEVVDNKDIVLVTVQKGTNSPYYIAEKGLKPSGVFVRSGSSTVMASEEHIRRMIKETDGEKYILGRSFNQELTFNEASRVFASGNVAFGIGEKITLGIVRSDGEFSNLGLLLSDQCNHTIKVAIFEGTTKAIFRDRKEFGGSIFNQLEDCYKYIDFYNKTNAEFKGLKRIDKRDYPERAIREALLNAIVHREYSFSGSILVNLYDDRLEVVSIGGIVFGLTLDAIKNGVSQTRNEKLANIFYRLKFIEAYGTGIPRIYDAYKGELCKPSISVTSDSFAITLPNTNYDKNNNKSKSEVEVSISAEQESQVLAFIKRKGKITRDELMEELNIGSTRSHYILSYLVSIDRLKKSKNGRKTEFSLV